MSKHNAGDGTLSFSDGKKAIFLELPAPQQKLFQNKKDRFLAYMAKTRPPLHEDKCLSTASVGYLATEIESSLPLIRKADRWDPRDMSKLERWAGLVAAKLSRGKPPCRPKEHGLNEDQKSQEAIFQEFEYWLMKNGVIRDEIFMNEGACLYHHPYDVTIRKDVERHEAWRSGERLHKIMKVVSVFAAIGALLAAALLYLLD